MQAQSSFEFKQNKKWRIRRKKDALCKKQVVDVDDIPDNKFVNKVT